MSLLKISYEAQESLLIKLVFEPEKIKRVKVEVGDYISVMYNKDGRRKTIDGYVGRIYLDNRYDHWPDTNCNHNQHWMMLINNSLEKNQCNPIDKVEVSRILDIDVLKRRSDTGYISSPIGEDRVTDLRLIGNTLQLSQDNGETWVKVLDLPVDKPAIEDCECDLVSKIQNLIPQELRADKQTELIEGIAKLLQAEKDCNCDCHEPEVPKRPPHHPDHDHHPHHCHGGVRKPVHTTVTIIK